MDEIEVDGVPIGPTEIVTFGTMLAALLTLVFHHDWGLAAHIQTIAAQALVVLPVMLGVVRSFKHHSAANVAIARIAAAAPTQAVDMSARLSTGVSNVFTGAAAASTEGDAAP